MLFFDIDSYNSFHSLPFTHDVNTKEKHILLKHGCEFPHSRIYLISTTHSFLISYRFFFSTVFVLDSPAAAPYLWHGTLQADASLRIARRFSESLADYNLESILFLLGRNSYHYPPQMILAKDLQKSIHSYKDSLRMRTGTDSFLTK